VAFQIVGLRRDQFDHVLTLDDDALATLGARWYTADAKPGFPCRVSLLDAEPGERVLLLPFQHQAGGSPYQASGPIFVRQTAQGAILAPDIIPELLRTRLLSVRAYDARHLMRDADVVDRGNLERLLDRFMEDERVSYLHIHFARPGCYICRVDRR
jgi:hypothetical protein